MSMAHDALDEERVHSVQLSVPDMHCAGCMGKVERSLEEIADVLSARVNLSMRRVRVKWQNNEITSEQLIERLADKGFAAQTIDEAEIPGLEQDRTGKNLLRCLALSGFAAANIMLLSISVWSGAGDSTRDLFHWISALIALPTIIYAGHPFYQSAWNALRHGTMNMDVPISLSVILAGCMSFYEVLIGREQIYFDAAVTLLFFLLVGRYLDHMMRIRVKNAAVELLKKAPKTALIENENGAWQKIQVSELKVGMKVVILPGGVVPVDGRIVAGVSELDCAHITGENLPELVKKPDQVFSGSVNLNAPLTMEVTAVGQDSFLSQVSALIALAEQHRSPYVRIADRLAAYYAPFVHIVALISFLGWLWATNGDWHHSMVVGISVLIITCPCALGLAVPIVQVVANSVLFDRGVLIKDGAALERLARIQTIVLDKTGTLTTGQLEVVDIDQIEEETLAMASALAKNSTHPLSRALSGAALTRKIVPGTCTEVREIPGCGLEGICNGRKVRIGRYDWCGRDCDVTPPTGQETHAETWVRIEDRPPVRIAFTDQLRSDAKGVIRAWKKRNLPVTLLSGDRQASVADVARLLAIDHFKAQADPAEKMDYIRELARSHRVLMIGDGINDAPALAIADVSMAPASASDIGRLAADVIFLGDQLAPAGFALEIARRSRNLIRQNFALALGYNLFAIPIAIAGLASPLVAAVAMSSSSIIVIANALRLRLGAAKGWGK